ncbi:PelD GGDEF domain-containing protein [Acidithiobacillus sp.]|uniref:PelD GGDEF domain-containing protein n=1 Tax=Acidithiobacillus sp. TaxID=1872118 RepID=UPI0032AFF4E6
MRFLTAIPRRGEGWVEAILLPIVALLLTHFLVPQDPLLLQQPFPWLLLIPLLIALRYEFLPGALAALILATAIWWHPYPLDHFLSVAAGTLLVTLIAAEYASHWVRREAGRALQEEITATRLRQLADDLYVTRTSLDRLEQSLLYQPVSVRSALQELRNDLHQSQGSFDVPVLEKVLYFLNQLAGVQVASWYRWEAGASRPQRLAALGKVSDWDGADPVARAALAEGHSQQLADLELERMHRYLSVHVHGHEKSGRDLLCIEDMSFFAITFESMKIIEVFFQYLCNHRDARISAEELLSRWSDCPVDFAADFLQLRSLAAIVPDVGICQRYLFHAGKEAQEIARRIQNLRRGLDVFWVHETEGHLLVLLLLPFAGSSAAEGQRARVEAELQKCCATLWESAFVRADFLPVDARPAAEQVARWLELRP